MNLEEQVSNINGNVNLILKKLEQVDGRLDRVEAKLTDHDQQFVSINRRFEQIDNRFDRIDGKLLDHDGRFDLIQGQFELLKGEMNHRFSKLDDILASKEIKVRMHYTTAFAVLTLAFSFMGGLAVVALDKWLV